MGKVKSIEAFETSDGSKFFEKIPAERQQTRVDFLEKKESIKNHLYDLLGIVHENDTKNFDSREEKFYQMMDESDTFDNGGLMLNVGVVEIIIDLVTFKNGAILKTAEYAKELLKRS